MKNYRKRFAFFSITIVMFLVLLISGCQSSSSGGSDVVPQTFLLKVLETTDVHGAIFPYDFINDRDSSTSLAQVYSYVTKQREMEGQEVLFLDNGDILQGQPIVYYSNFEAVDKPHVTATIMNYMGYDAGAIGNHDIEAGHDVYDKLVDEYDFPWLAANIVKAGTETPYFEPYTVFEINGAKIVVLGMCTPGVPTWLPENLWEGMEFKGMVETAEKWVPIIMEEEDPDVLIGLFHSGTDFAYSGYASDDDMNPNGAELVAEQVPGFDVIFTGHDHAGHNYEVQSADGSTVLILGALNAARTIAVANIELYWNVDLEMYKVMIAGEIIEGESLEADPSFLADFDDMKEEVKAYVGKPIGIFSKTISTQDSMFGDSAFVDLIHNLQLELTDADASFAAPLSMNAWINEGEVYVRDMFNLYKYENLLYTMELTGQQIKDFLEYSYEYWFATMSGPDDHLINFKLDENGEPIWNDRYSSYDTATRYYNFDSAAGFDYTVDVSKPAGSRITISGFSNGDDFELTASYSVAINSYRASGGGGHLTKGAGIPDSELESIMLTSTIKDLRFYLIKMIEEQGTINPEPLGNWKVIPEAWAEAGRETDFPMLYGE